MGHIYFIMGVSGAGKGTLIKHLHNENIPNLHIPLSYKTRAIRETEKNGVDAWFISKEDFFSQVQSGLFLEYAMVHGMDYYGTKFEDVIDNGISKGLTVIKELDIIGLQDLRKNKPELDEKYTTIFLNDFSILPTKRVDEKAFGMHGQVISPEPLKKAIDFVLNKIGKKVKIVYLTPSGELLTQQKVENYYKELSTEFIIICGHYEGIDQRIIDKYVDYSISIGEYVISSGELSSMVFIDSLVRHIPGVLGNQLSLEEDSFGAKLNRQKEYPVYTKPRVFEGLEVPEVLFSGNHKEISAWKSKNLR